MSKKCKYRVNGKVLTGGLFCTDLAVADAVLIIYTEQYAIAQGGEHYEISEEFKAILEESGLQLDDVRNMTYSDLQAS